MEENKFDFEALARQAGEQVKPKGAFSSEDAIIKQIYLAKTNANIKWQEQLGWTALRNELVIYFGERLLKNDTLYYALPFSNSYFVLQPALPVFFLKETV